MLLLQPISATYGYPPQQGRQYPLNTIRIPLFQLGGMGERSPLGKLIAIEPQLIEHEFPQFELIT